MEQLTAPGYRNALEQWMRENRYSDPALALEIAKRLNIDAFSTNTVRKWRRGEAFPRPGSANARALCAVTGMTYQQIQSPRP